MKNKFLSFLVLISFFLCFTEVNAEENKVYWKLGSTRDEQLTNSTGELQKYLEEYKDSVGLDGFLYSDISKIEFNNGEKVTDCAGEYDLSRDSDGSVMVCLKKEGTRQNMYIQYDGILYFNENSAGIFRNFAGVTSIVGLENINTSEVRDMSYMFYMNNILPTLDLSSFDTSNVVDMRDMFWSTSKLTSLDISSFNTSNVKYMSSMFEGMSSITSLDLSNFDTSNVTSMSSMFQYNKSLKKLDLSNFNTSKVKSMRGIFYLCESLTELDLSNFDTTSVTDMVNMFRECLSLEKIDISNFNTSNVTDMHGMFYKTPELHTLISSEFDTSNVTNMAGMFFSIGVSSLDLRNFNTSKVTDMYAMFSGAENLVELDISSFNTSNVTNMADMFRTCSSLSTLRVNHFDTSKVTDMSFMFSGVNVNELDLSNFNTSKVTNMHGMFSFVRLIDLDLSSFDTSNVTGMGEMFESAFNIETVYVSNLWNTDSVKYSNNMFKDCINLVGEAGTKYDKNHLDKEYARIDKINSSGYLSLKGSISSITVNKNSISLVIGQSDKVIATINPSDTTSDKTLTWTSSSTKVATVDQNGNIKAIGAGTATITVTTVNGKSATITINVIDPNIPIMSVKINQSSLSVVVGKTGKLAATINPSNTTDNRTLTWSSSNTKIATVDQNGVVKGIKAGTATITVKTSNGKTHSIKVAVKKPVPIKSVKLNKKSIKVSIGKSYKVKATINPDNTTDSKTLTWSSSNKKVATVDNSGRITGINAGTATITVKTSNGKKGKVTVTVSKIKASKASISKIADQLQNGQALKPSIEVNLNGKILEKGTDYTVSYKNNKNSGKATVTVKFKGNYTGTKSTSFKIIPKKVSIKNPSTSKKTLTVKYSKVSGAKTYQIAYRVIGTDTWKYVTSKTSSKKISKLTSGKEYEVKVRAGVKIGKTIYGEWSDIKTIIVK